MLEACRDYNVDYVKIKAYFRQLLKWAREPIGTFDESEFESTLVGTWAEMSDKEREFLIDILKESPVKCIPGFTCKPKDISTAGFWLVLFETYGNYWGLI